MSFAIKINERMCTALFCVLRCLRLPTSATNSHRFHIHPGVSAFHWSFHRLWRLWMSQKQGIVWVVFRRWSWSVIEKCHKIVELNLDERCWPNLTWNSQQKVQFGSASVCKLSHTQRKSVSYFDHPAMSLSSEDVLIDVHKFMRVV